MSGEDILTRIILTEKDHDIRLLGNLARICASNKESFTFTYVNRQQASEIHKRLTPEMDRAIEYIGLALALRGKFE